MPPGPDAPSPLGDPRLKAIDLKLPDGAGIPASNRDYFCLMVAPRADP
jgi:hypothetical protein